MRENPILRKGHRAGEYGKGPKGKTEKSVEPLSLGAGSSCQSARYGFCHCEMIMYAYTTPAGPLQQKSEATVAIPAFVSQSLHNKSFYPSRAAFSRCPSPGVSTPSAAPRLFRSPATHASFIRAVECVFSLGPFLLFALLRSQVSI